MLFTCRNTILSEAQYALIKSNYCLVRYKQENVQMSGLWRTPSADLPEFLHGRPHVFRDSIKEAFTASMAITHEMITPLEVPGSFEVKGSKAQAYQCSLGPAEEVPHCTCPDFMRKRRMCKHILAVMRLELWAWEQLPTAYMTSPFLNVDPSVLGDQHKEQSPQLEVDDYAHQQGSITTSDMDMMESPSNASSDSPVPAALSAKDSDSSELQQPNIGHKARAVIAHIRGLTFTTSSDGALEEAVVMLKAVEEHLLHHQARDGDMLVPSVRKQPLKRPPNVDIETHAAKRRRVNKAKQGV